MSMRIGVDAREICDRPAGKGQYLLRVLANAAFSEGLELLLYTKPGQSLPASAAGHRQVEVAGKGPLWHRAVGRRLRADRVDAFFACLSYLSAAFNPVPTLTVVHDLAVFRLPDIRHNRRSFLVERLSLRACCRKSAALVAVSQSTAADLSELMGVPRERISVATGAPLLMGRQEPLARGQRKPFILFTGTLEPRKNLQGVLRSFAALPGDLRAAYRLKLAGKPGWGGEDYPALAASLGIGDRVDFLGYVDDAELARLFRHAAVFLYPSRYEGFGLPVAEAMSVGTPVVTSSVSSLPEVVGPRGITCDPTDTGAIAAALAGLLTDGALYAAQSRYLYERSAAFSWDGTAAAIRAGLEGIAGAA